ncbi:MAG TPA: SCP2 sterol-binding domain-containing protein [Polyangiales bacterium]
MALAPVDFCLQELPRLFEQAKAKLQAFSADGDKRAQARLKDVAASRVTARVFFEGEGGGEAFLVNDRGSLQVSQERPAAPAVHYALAVSAGAAQRALGLLDTGEIELAVAHDPRHPPGIGSARADQLFTMYKFGFEVQLLGLPELGDVSLRIGLGRDLPTTPEFRLSVRYADLLAARDQAMGPQELFSSGKLVITGDAAKAMMLGMTLAQLR